jgi:hypothetical protein
MKRRQRQQVQRTFGDALRTQGSVLDLANDGGNRGR